MIEKFILWVIVAPELLLILFALVKASKHWANI